MLIELADPRPAEPPVGQRLALRGGHQMRQVGFDVGFDSGAGALEMAETFHFVGNELIVGRVPQGQEAFQEGGNLGGPCASGGLRRLGWESSRTCRAGRRCAARRASCGSRRGGLPRRPPQGCRRRSRAENFSDEFHWQMMDELFLFTPLTWVDAVADQPFRRHPSAMGALLPNPRSLTHKAKGLDGCRFGPRTGIEPTRGPEAKAPLAKTAAPVALQQSRILRATHDVRF